MAAPVASFTYIPSPVYIGETVSFTDTSTNTPTSWLWSFNDGNTSTDQNPTHAFADQGTFSVELTASNVDGDNIFIEGILVLQIVPNFTVAPSPTTPGTEITITNTTLGVPAHFSWDFGDGTTNTIDWNPTHTYPVAGVYDITLTVYWGGGGASVNVVHGVSVTGVAGTLTTAYPGPFLFPVNTGFINIALPTSGGYEPYHWAIVENTSLPVGMVLNPNTGYIFGSTLNVEEVDFKIGVSDSNPIAASIQTFTTDTIHISVVTAPSLDPNSVRAFPYINVPLSIVVPITGGTAPFTIDPPTWDWSYPNTEPQVSNARAGISYSIVGTDIHVDATIIDDIQFNANFVITDANGFTTNLYIEFYAVDNTIGVGGKGVPHTNWAAPYVQMCCGTGNTVTGATLAPLVYGGAAPYVLTNVIGLPSAPTGTSIENRYDVDWAYLVNGDEGYPRVDGSFAAGIYPVTFDITDANGNTSTLSSTLTIAKYVVINETPLPVGKVGVPYSFVVESNYVPTDIYYPVSFNIDTNGQGLLPTGMQFSPNPNHAGGLDILDGTATQSNSFPITISGANNEYGSQCRKQSWNTTLYIVSNITVTHDPVPYIYLGIPFTLQFYAADGIAPYTWELGAVPTPPVGISINPTTGLLSGNLDTLGGHVVRIIARDATDAIGLVDIDFAVASPTQDFYMCPSTQTTVTFPVSGGVGPYTIDGITSGSLPPGMSFTPGSVPNPSITGICNISGDYDVVFTVNDAGLGEILELIAHIHVYPAGILDTGSIQALRYNIPYYSKLIINSSLSQDNFIIGLYSGTLPPGIAFSGDVSNASLSGVPNQEGTFPVKFSVTNSSTGCVILQDYIFVVTRLSLEAVLPCAQPNLPYSYDLVVKGGTPPYRFFVLPGYELPTDLKIDENFGRFYGSVYTEGIYDIGIRIVDSKNDFIDKHFTLICSKDCQSTVYSWLPSPQSKAVTVGEYYFEENLISLLPKILEE
jgi:PKD repeat protein